MLGSVVVDNNTGHAIRVAGCETLFQVVLVNNRYRPEVAWLTCLQWFTIPTGESRYRVTVGASYRACGQGRPEDGLKACLAGNRPPPLPPGEYHAKLFQISNVVPAPPALAIRVTRSGPLR
jgi:hypothetical protein